MSWALFASRAFRRAALAPGSSLDDDEDVVEDSEKELLLDIEVVSALWPALRSTAAAFFQCSRAAADDSPWELLDVRGRSPPCAPAASRAGLVSSNHWASRNAVAHLVDALRPKPLSSLLVR
jgi:hypothetical protein